MQNVGLNGEGLEHTSAALRKRERAKAASPSWDRYLALLLLSFARLLAAMADLALSGLDKVTREVQHWRGSEGRQEASRPGVEVRLQRWWERRWLYVG